MLVKLASDITIHYISRSKSLIRYPYQHPRDKPEKFTGWENEIIYTLYNHGAVDLNKTVKLDYLIAIGIIKVINKERP